MSFVVFSLPRSRSTWLSHFLSYRGRVVGHDVGIGCESPDEFMRAVGDGTCETGAAFAWRLIRDRDPKLRFAVIRRPAVIVAARLAELGLDGQFEEMVARERHLAEISALPGTLTLDMEGLANESICRLLFEFCTGARHDRAWWQRFDRTRIETDLPKRLALLRDRAPQIAKLKAAAQARMHDALL